MPYIPVAVVNAGGGTAAVADPLSVFGDPTTAFEFETSSLAGLTALSTTPDAEDADTSVPGCYFLRDNAAGVSYCGRYFAPPATPFTAITRVSDSNTVIDFNLSGIFVGESTPGAFVNWGMVNTTRVLQRNAFTNPTSSGAATATTHAALRAPFYLALRVNSTSNVDFLFSYEGQVWWTFFAGVDPSLTIGSVGLGMASVNAAGLSVAFDFIRVWNSALTFPGVP